MFKEVLGFSNHSFQEDLSSCKDPSDPEATIELKKIDETW